MTETVVNTGAAEVVANPVANAVVTPPANAEVVTPPASGVNVTPPANETVVNTGNKEEIKSWIADDWREKLSAGDAKELARLQRFPDIGSVYKSYREIEGKLSSGALKQEVDVSKLTPEQLTEYRKGQGVPEKAEDYQLQLDPGVVIGAEDEAVLGSVLETMHSQNRKPAEVSAVVNAFYKAREAEVGAFIEA